MIRFIQVTKTPYLDNISFNIKRNEIAIIHNENYKILQILLNLIRGKIEPASGVIRLLDSYEAGEKILKYERGIVFKESILLDNRSLRENFQFVVEIMGLNSSYLKNRIKKTLKLVNLKDYEDRKPSTLPLHYVKRANIACALLSYPSILILDNPFNNIDEINSRGIYHLLEKINKLGITVLILNCQNNFLIKNKKQRRIIYLQKGDISNYYC